MLKRSFRFFLKRCFEGKWADQRAGFSPHHPSNLKWKITWIFRASVFQHDYFKFTVQLCKLWINNSTGSLKWNIRNNGKFHLIEFISIYISALEADIFLVDAGCGLTQKPHTEGLIWVSGGSKETSANPREAKRWQARKCCSDWMKTSRSPNHNLLRGERKQEDVIHRAHKENSRKKDLTTAESWAPLKSF